MKEFYEAVSVTVAPEREGVYDTELGQLEFEKNTDDGPGWYDHGCEEYKRPKYWLRPLPVPEGLPSEEDIKQEADKRYPIARYEDYIQEENNAFFVGSAMWMRDRLAPLIASQQAEIERLKAALNSECLRSGDMRNVIANLWHIKRNAQRPEDVFIVLQAIEKAYESLTPQP